MRLSASASCGPGVPCFELHWRRGNHSLAGIGGAGSCPAGRSCLTAACSHHGQQANKLYGMRPLPKYQSKRTSTRASPTPSKRSLLFQALTTINTCPLRRVGEPHPTASSQTLNLFKPESPGSLNKSLPAVPHRLGAMRAHACRASSCSPRGNFKHLRCMTVRAYLKGQARATPFALQSPQHQSWPGAELSIHTLQYLASIHKRYLSPPHSPSPVIQLRLLAIALGFAYSPAETAESLGAPAAFV